MQHCLRSIASADEYIFKLFRTSASLPNNVFGPLTMSIGNQMLRMHGRMRNSGRAKAMIRTMDELSKRRNIKADNLADIVTYDYYAARVYMMVGQPEVAKDLLMNALKVCHKNSKKNRRLIIELLLPIKLVCEGLIPKRRSLAQYGLPNLDDMMESFRIGDVSRYEDAVDEICVHCRDISLASLWMSSSIFVYRNWFRRLSVISGRSRFSFSLLSHLLTTIPVAKKDEMDPGDQISKSEEELICIVLELIQRGYIKARISTATKRRLLMRKYEPFPKVADVIISSKN
ncbi:hypothetical protein ACOME3_000699 [Neoechinorhynchus agilis]